MNSINNAIQQIKARLTQLIPQTLIKECFTPPKRQRLLDPITTTLLFARQIIHCNCSIAQLRRYAKIDISESAYCDARKRLDDNDLNRLAQRLAQRNRPHEPTWQGRRLWLIDGSSFSMPDMPELQKAFGQPGGQTPGCGFPVAHLLALFNAHDGTLHKAIATKMRTHDMAHAALTHEALASGDVLVGDRAFGSYAHLALLQKRGCDGIFRAHQRLKIAFDSSKNVSRTGMRARCVRVLGYQDQVMEYRKPKKKPDWMTEAEYAKLPATIQVRETRRSVRNRNHRVGRVTLVSTFLDAKDVPAKALSEAYGGRWQVEVNLRHVKTTLGLEVLKCKTEKGVRRELAMMVVIYNLVCGVMREAGKKQKVSPCRISFKDALTWLCEASADEPIPRLKVNPVRSRLEPRELKRRGKPYKLMRRPRKVLRDELRAKQSTLAA